MVYDRITSQENSDFPGTEAPALDGQCSPFFEPKWGMVHHVCIPTGYPKKISAEWDECWSVEFAGTPFLDVFKSCQHAMFTRKYWWCQHPVLRIYISLNPSSVQSLNETHSKYNGLETISWDHRMGMFWIFWTGGWVYHPHYIPMIRGAISVG